MEELHFNDPCHNPASSELLLRGVCGGRKRTWFDKDGAIIEHRGNSCEAGENSDESSVHLSRRPSSSHLLTHSGTTQTKKNLAMASRSREKSTLSQQVETSPGRCILDRFGPNTGGQRTTVLANQIPCRHCIQLCAGRLHLQNDFSEGRKHLK